MAWATCFGGTLWSVCGGNAAAYPKKFSLLSISIEPTTLLVDIFFFCEGREGNALNFSRQFI